jgi:galactokinase
MESSQNIQKALKQKFFELYGIEPEIIVRAPGRVNIIGEHTDYNDGFVLPMAIDRFFWIALSPRSDSLLRVFSLDLDEQTTFDSSCPAHTENGHWSEYFRGIAWAMTDQGYLLQGWDGVATGDIPIGAGLSSSAAVELAVARAFCEASGIEWLPIEMARIAQRAEIEWVGVNCGIMDQLISAAGISGHALLIDCRSLQFEAVPLPKGTVVVVLDTGTRRGLVDSAYNERRQQCEQAAAFFGVPALRDVSMDVFLSKSSEMPLLIQKRARHIISENDRTVMAAGAMRLNDAPALGGLMNESHLSLAVDFEVSCEALDAIALSARNRPECYGARMTGAGFGGCGVALVESANVAEFTRNVSEDYRNRTGLEARLYVCQPVDGATVLESNPK